MSRQIATVIRFVLFILGVTAVLAFTVHAAPTNQTTDAARPRFNLAQIPHQSGKEPPAESALAVSTPNLLLPWSKIAFQSYRNSNWDIFVGNDDGSGQTAVANSGNSEIQPHLNRGNTKIVYATNSGGDYEIYTMNTDGTGQTALTTNDTNDGNPSWSPDGSKIVFETYRHGNADIYVMNTNGTGQVRLTSDADFDGMPTWSPDGSQIAYDADGDGDGWQDLWRMNADGSSQAMVYNPSGQTDAWASSWSPDGKRIVYTLISFINYQGNWYWTYAYPDAWGSGLGTTRLSSNGLDWDASWQTSDNSAPGLVFNSPPQYSRNPLALSWTGTDFGSAGIKGYDVQYRTLGATAWNDLMVGTTTTATNFNGSAGQTYQFRVRATDNALNRSTWQYHFQTTIYNWAIAGNIYDNRGNPISGATTTTTPASFEAHPSDFLGFFQNYVGGTPATYSVNWLKNGYGNLPATSFTPAQDAMVSMALPPADNILLNWGFEDGQLDLSGWQMPGLPSERIMTEQNTGSYSVLMGNNAEPEPINVSSSSFAPSHSPSIVSTDDGKTHVVWIEGDVTGTCRIRYRNWTSEGLLSPIESFSNEGEKCYYNSLVPNTDGSLHISWLQTISGINHVYYIHRNSNGNWSSIEDVSLTAFTSSQPHLASNGNGKAYLVWDDRENNEDFLYFSERDEISGWSSPINISPGLTSRKTFLIAVDPFEGIHIFWREMDNTKIYEDSIYAVYRPNMGAWTSPVQVVGPNGDKGIPAIDIDATGIVHAVWANTQGFPNDIYYSSRSLDGTWATPIQISTSGASSDVRITTSSSGKLYVLWQSGEFYYATKSQSGTWGAAQAIPSITAFPALFQVDESDNLHLAWQEVTTAPAILYSVRKPNNEWATPIKIYDPVDPFYFNRAYLSPLGMVNFAWVIGPEEWDSMGEILSTSISTGIYTLSQIVDIPVSMENPTLSLFAKPAINDSAQNITLDINVDNGLTNEIFFLNVPNSPTWSHNWIDLSQWQGETVTIDVSYELGFSAPFNGVYVDEITLGSAFTDIGVQVEGPREAQHGEEITFNVIYENSSSIVAEGVVLTAVLPPQLTFLNASLPPTSQSPTLTWNIGDLPANSGTQSFTITARVKNSAQGLSNAVTTVNISTSSTELEALNNSDQSELFVGARLFIPLITKN